MTDSECGDVCTLFENLWPNWAKRRGEQLDADVFHWFGRYTHSAVVAAVRHNSREQFERGRKNYQPDINLILGSLKGITAGYAARNAVDEAVRDLQCVYSGWPDWVQPPESELRRFAASGWVTPIQRYIAQLMGLARRIRKADDVSMVEGIRLAKDQLEPDWRQIRLSGSCGKPQGHKVAVTVPDVVRTANVAEPSRYELFKSFVAPGHKRGAVAAKPAND